MSDETLADLKKRFRNRVLLSPADIADIISTSTAVQANMRARGTFPMPIIKTGRKVGVNIHHLADYLNGKPMVAISGPALTAKTPTTAPAKRARRGAKDWLVAFSAAVKFQMEVFAYLEKIELTKSLGEVDEALSPRRVKV